MKKDEYYEKRHSLIFNDSRTGRKVIKKGKIFKDAHICSLCGKPLTSYGYSTGRYVVDTKFYLINLPSFVYANLCYNASDCYDNYCSKHKE